MADNVGYTPGSGASIAADDIGGVLHQRVKVVLGADGTSAGDVSSSNPMPVAPSSTAVFDVNAVGELIECLEAMRQYQISLNRTIGMLMPDTSGRMRVLLDAITANLTLATVSTVTAVTTVSTVSSVTNVAAIGGNTSTAELVYGAMHVGADSLRRNITIS